MGRIGRHLITAAVLVGLVLVAGSCGGGSALTGRTSLANIANLDLAAGRPGSVVVCVDAEQKLRVSVVTKRSLRSCTLIRIAASDGSSVESEAVPLQESPRSDSDRSRTWTTTEPVTPGAYKVRLQGEGRIVSLVVEKVAEE